MPVCIVGEAHAKARMARVDHGLNLLADKRCRWSSVSLSFVARHVPIGPDADRLPDRPIRICSDTVVCHRAVFFDAGDLRRSLGEIKPDGIYRQSRPSYTADVKSGAYPAAEHCF